MAYVKQKGKKDCGIAALAMLCDVTYEEAEAAIPWRKHGLLYGTTTTMLREGGKRLGYTGLGTPKHQLKRITKPWVPGVHYSHELWHPIPDNSLVKIPGPHSWHWVAWRKGKIYDPALGVFNPSKYFGGRAVAYMQFVLDL